MGAKSIELGKWGESQAAAFLTARGYRILDRNVYTRFGELDLVARKSDSGQETLVFVEVKTRTSTRFGFPEQAVTAGKLDRMFKSVQAYLLDHPEYDIPYQMDVISIYLEDTSEAPEINHYRNVSI